MSDELPPFSAATYLPLTKARRLIVPSVLLTIWNRPYSLARARLAMSGELTAVSAAT